MRDFFILLLAILLPLGTIAQPEQFSMQEAIDYALDKNDQIDLKKLDVRDADAQILEYWATGIPTLDGNVNYQHYINIPTSLVPAQFFGGQPGTFAEIQFGTKNNLQAGLELNALIFDGSFFVGLKAQQLYKDLRQKELSQTKTEVEYNVTKAFLNVLVAEKNLEILQKNIDNLSSNLNEVRESYEAGFLEKLDVDRLELSLQQLKTQQQSVEGNAWVAKNLLKFQMGYPINDSLSVDGDLESVFSSDLVKRIDTDATINVERRPEHEIALKGLDLNNVDIKRNKASYLPTIRGFASHSESLQRNDLFDENEAPWLPTSIVGATLNLTIFDGLNRKAKLQRAKVSKEKTLQQINQLEESIRMEVTNARIQYNNAQRQLSDAQKNLDLSEEIYETTQTKFDEGVGSSLEVKQAESDYYAAQASYIDALYNLLIAYTDLQKANGTL